MKILNLNLFDALSLFEVKSSSHKKNISCCLKDHNLNKNFWKNKIYVKLIFQLQIRLNPRHSNFRSPCRQYYTNGHIYFIICGFPLEQRAKVSCWCSPGTKYEYWLRHFINFNFILALFSKLLGLAMPKWETYGNFWSYISNHS